jgi:hypothetical protein
MLDCRPAGKIEVTENADMAMGRREVERQADFWVPTAELPQSPGHPFREQLNRVLAAAGGGREGPDYNAIDEIQVHHQRW